MKLKFDITYKANGEVFNTKSGKCEHFALETAIIDGVLSIVLKPKVSVEFVRFSVITPYEYQKNDRIFVNGYQSWTDSMEYSVGEKMGELTRLMELAVNDLPLKYIGMNKSGDSTFWSYPRKENVFYGWSYGYVRRGNLVDIFGSLNERFGYTVVTFNVNNNTVQIAKELEGVVYSNETPLLSLAMVSGEYDDAFDRYFEKMGVTCRETKRRTGYTTWYNYYGNITEDVVNRDLESIANLDVPFDCFQIDDGYQRAIGDWLITDSRKFPNGMKKIADDIHSKGMIAGLWLAPFAGVKSSQLFKEHQDWFIKGPDGKPYNTGHNWGGFYSLDIYNEGAREYIKNVFDTVLNVWGYDLVKLDFLYGAAVLPMHNKTRGEIMCDAMDLLRECCGDKLILGCGVPMMPAFGKVDYCRIGSDISLKWKCPANRIREDVSTPHAVCNSIFRRHLDGRAWKNDPDVFLLRDTNLKLTFEQRKLLAKINSVFGNLLFISDNVSDYNEQQLAVLKETFASPEIEIIQAEFTDKDVMTVEFFENGVRKNLCFNIRTGETLY